MNFKDFKDVKNTYRPAPFWSWNDHLDIAELKRQIDEMNAQGWGSFFMHSRVGLVTEYLSEEWMECIRSSAEYAEKNGMTAWLYDEDKWPSGFAGGKVPENPAYRGRALVLLEEGQVTENDTELCTYEGKKIAVRISPLGSKQFNGMCYVDLMNPAAVQEFIRCTHEKYKEACGKYFGKEIPGIFTDEPCYLMYNAYSCPVLPWSDCLPAFFIERKGYDLREKLPELFFETGTFRKTRFDFFDCCVRLFVQSFTKQYADWCHENNLLMVGHYMAEDTLRNQIEWLGAVMPNYIYMDYPGVDKLANNHDQLNTMKQVSSVAEQLQKPRTFCEVYGCIGHQSGFAVRKNIADWEAVLGINFINSHLSHYSMRGERKRDYPSNLFYQQPWWDEERNFADYSARMSYALTQGRRTVDILVLHPIASVWCEYDAIENKKGINRKTEKYDRLFELLNRQLIAKKLDYHLGDEMVMEEYGEIVDGKLKIGAYTYSTIVLPAVTNMNRNTKKLLEQFEGKLICLDETPKYLEGEPAAFDFLEKCTLCGQVADVIAVLDRQYPDRIQLIDQRSGGNADALICQERILEDGSRMVFAVNTEATREITARLSICAEGTPYLLDLVDGGIKEPPYTIENGRIVMEMKMYPSSSVLLYFSKEKVAVSGQPKEIGSGVIFSDFSQKPLMDLKIEKTTLLDPNSFAINDATLWMNGELVGKDMPLQTIWHQHFYPAPDGTPYQMEYTFTIVNKVPENICAAIETAENLDEILINGNPVKPEKACGELGTFDPEKSYLDINFTKVKAAPYLQMGENKITIKGKKVNNITGRGNHVGVRNFKEHKPTEAEAVYLFGDFTVWTRDKVHFTVDGNVMQPDPFHLVQSGYPFYNGKISFSITANLAEVSDDMYLQAYDVRFDYVKVRINGNEAGVRYSKPYLFAVGKYLHVGENLIEVEASTNLFNLMGPNRHDRMLEKPWTSPDSFVDMNQYTEEYTFVPFGIGGFSLLG